MTHSIVARFRFSLLANLSKAVITFGTGLLVARGLGPEQFGVMAFLLGTFAAIRQLFDAGSSSAFFTFISQRNRSLRFVGWYFCWLAVQFFITLLAVGLLFPSAWIEIIWRGEQRSLVVLAFLVSYIQSTLWSAALQIAESQRLTFNVQLVSVSVALTHFLLVALIWWLGWLTVNTIFMILIVEWVVAIVVMAKQLRFPLSLTDVDTPKSILFEFWRYCLPLLPYSWFGFAYEFLDRWLLQKYAGSVEQAYYAVAYQFGTIAGIATASILNIFWKEIAEAHHQNNTSRVAILYRKITRGLFFISAIVAGFLALWTHELLQLLLGTQYVGGAITLTIMLFYPLHQSIGQIVGTMAYATGRVSGYVTLNMVFMTLSMIVTYLMLAPADESVPGLGGGSIGLSIKMVLMQFFQVSVLSFYLSRSLKISFDWLYQPITIITCISFGFSSKILSNLIFESDGYLVFNMAFSALIYVVLIIALLIKFPDWIGVDLTKAKSWTAQNTNKLLKKFYVKT